MFVNDERMILMSFAIDIETIPDLSMVDLLPPVSASRTLKDPAKIAADIEEKARKQKEAMSLDPLFAKIICIGVYNPHEKIALMGEENQILKDFWSVVGKHAQIITFNGRRFDLDVILKRGVKHGIGNFFLDRFLRDRGKSGRVIDIMDDFCLYGEFRSLDTLSKVYLGKQKKEIDFKLFPELLESEEGRNKIADYCLYDAQLTYELAQKLGYCINEH